MLGKYKSLISFNSFFERQDTRSKVMYANALASIFFRIANIVISFLLIPILIKVLNSYEYGTWLTIASLVSWINYFDIGLGSGLKNKLGESLAKNNKILGREYVSSSYFLMCLISTFLFLFLVFLSGLFDIYSVFNIDVNKIPNLHILFIIVLSSTLINFTTKLLDNVLFALQKTAINNVKLAISQVTILLYLYIISLSNVDNVLIFATLGLTFIPVFFNIIFSIYFYFFKYEYLSPNFKSIKVKHFKSLFSLGINFFLIQIGVLVMFQTQSLILVKVLGPESVTSYNISYKFYTVLYMLLTIIMVPFWSGVLEAYNKEDFRWLKNKIKQLLKLNIILIVIINFVLIYFDKFILEFWLGQKFTVDFELKYSLIVYTILLSFLTIAMNLINGVGKLKVQLILYMGAVVLNIPLSYYLIIKYNISGVVISSILIFIIMNIVLWRQVYLILNKNTYGLWNK